MFLWDWFSGVLNYLGFYKKSGTIVLFGLDNAGKTTLLHMLKTNSVLQPVPTLHATTENFTLGGLNLTTIDLGGHLLVRQVWKDYFPVADGIVFLLDANDTKRFAEAKKELDSLLADEQIAELPVLILGNKIDKLGAESESHIRRYFGLIERTTGMYKIPRSELHSRPMELFMCSVTSRMGYGEGFRWLAQYIN